MAERRCPTTTKVQEMIGGGSVDMKPYVVRDSTGNQAITGTEVTVNMNTIELSNAGYSLAGDEITVNQNGVYLILWAIAYDITNTSGGTRGCVEGHIEENSGGSFVDIMSSYGRVYHREAAGGSGLSGATIVQLNNGNKIRLQVRRANGSTNLDTVANKSSVSIMKVG